MQQLAAQTPARTRLLFRGDSGFFVRELMDWLDQNGHGYLIKVKLKGLSALLDKQSWHKSQAGQGSSEAVSLMEGNSLIKRRAAELIRILQNPAGMPFWTKAQGLGP